ncbi:KEOPS complex subunit Pcc1 [Halococcus sp. IIIV-5B]|uniref:KEOPS complex subunit Pcc1 n=1 Tax=Halococcus sp. IIIV-5B TaxID=2321230 RepID=UPI000E73251F|nr:KEOPS complex subunit Pcc1 [Halococcus sp. IIIV-5B]RJT03875.1 KEOPS complex Pcc1-like subunit [Halococcus sp. IIIV-5B]
MKRARVRTRSVAPETVAAALVPDNTPEMHTGVDGEVVATTLERETVGGLRATLDDYTVNLSVAERVVQAAQDGTNDTNQTHS